MSSAFFSFSLLPPPLPPPLSPRPPPRRSRPIRASNRATTIPSFVQSRPCPSPPAKWAATPGPLRALLTLNRLGPPPKPAPVIPRSWAPPVPHGPGHRRAMTPGHHVGPGFSAGQSRMARAGQTRTLFDALLRQGVGERNRDIVRPMVHDVPADGMYTRSNDQPHFAREPKSREPCPTGTTGRFCRTRRNEQSSGKPRFPGRRAKHLRAAQAPPARGCSCNRRSWPGSSCARPPLFPWVRCPRRPPRIPTSFRVLLMWTHALIRGAFPSIYVHFRPRGLAARDIFGFGRARAPTPGPGGLGPGGLPCSAGLRHSYHHPPPAARPPLTSWRHKLKRPTSSA